MRTGSSDNDVGEQARINLGTQIRCAVERIDHGLRVQVKCNGIDREVAGAQVFLQILAAIGGEIQEGARAIRVRSR